MSKELPSIAVGIVLNDRDEMLLVERANPEILEDNRVLSIVFPGGKVEDETPEEAAVREIKEETGESVLAAGIIFGGEHSHAPVFINYVACSLIEGQRETVDDPAVRRSFWLPKFMLTQTVTSPVHPEILKYLHLQ